MLLFLLYLPDTLSSIYGIDFGSQNVRVSIGVPGKPVAIVPNDEGYRATPNYLGYEQNTEFTNVSQAEWVVGSNAARIYQKDPNRAVKNPFQYFNTNQVPIEGVNPITLGAITLSLYLKNFMKQHDKLIITVPSIFPPQARRRIVQSLSLLNISSAQILDSNVAVATLYAIERLKKSNDHENVTENVMFVDIGSIQTEISNWKFERLTSGVIRIELLDYRFSDEIGGGYIDDVLYEYVVQKLPCSPTPSESKSIRQLMIKCKERLASGHDQSLNLLDMFNISIPITTALIDEIASGIISKLYNLFNGIQINGSIELIGGSTRLPSFHKVIQERFSNHSIRRSLNSDEAVAFGATYYSSLQSGTIIGSRLEIIRPSIYGLEFFCNNRLTKLIRTGEISDRKSITMHKFKDFNFSLYVTKDIQNDNITSKVYNSVRNDFTNVSLLGLTEITRNITNRIANGSKPFIRINFGRSQVLDCHDYISSSLSANVSINVSIKGEYNSLESAPMNTNLRSKLMFSDEINFNKTNNINFIKDYINTSTERKLHAEVLNKLESFIIDLQDKIQYDNDFADVITDEEKSEIINILSHEKEAIDFSGARVTSKELEKRYEKIEEKLSDILNRYNEYKQRPLYIMKLNKTIQRAYNELEKANTDNQTISEFKEIIQKGEEMINDTLKIEPKNNPNIFIKDLQEQERRLLRRFSSLKAPRKVYKQTNSTTKVKDNNSKMNVTNNETDHSNNQSEIIRNDQNESNFSKEL
ncbi:dnaK protein [Histomonas meleagridis]|uniref:dnaK protein n=1 Tax=Histomonas meleagridis TaxID=135588 RepID=UPI00355949A9|nr:dnaK protein [Histomonas meleagridis]KAH0800798.1 dnaK protein [Histomonas meleagridis]